MKKIVFCAVVLMLAPAFLLLISLFALPALSATRDIELVEDFTPKLSNGTGDLYVPLPQEGTSYQKVLSQNVTGNQNSVKIEKIPLGLHEENEVRVLHAHWTSSKNPSLKIVEDLQLSDREAPEQDSKSIAYFLKGTDHVQTGGVVAAKAREITKDLHDPDQKARAIYEWIVDNTFRDPATRGCGLGDVRSMIESGHLQGKCADLNSLFVGLARAAGIPAREVWGLRVAEASWQKILGKGGDVSKAQHCRAEYYSENKKGWVPVDPADIRKLILDGKMTAGDPDVQRMRQALFGSWEGNWVAFNYGRDFKLPGQKKKINYLMYPQLVTRDTTPDGMDPSEVSYTLTSRAIQ